MIISSSSPPGFSTRALFLNAKAALDMSRRVAELMASELNRDAAWKEHQMRAFEEMARN